ncbi:MULTISPECIES: TetR/AcrR family transcriptional regulator [Phyllobacteriaceae]|jgi:AcrR family transcriptional regulator|uniref:TetR family transcriptional regulator n=1 Tax=Mesorhizobium hungaricum TaxID=1566387 RepID=A0A1C2DYW6_9HYPH|nr:MULTISPECIES: TetR/AcrR family transcriptional regulator [Mesorhizobium]MBN9234601.1 TetR/AcrR family transcriptional regulator [Mesorhizobium sp.]MDQ0328919.1 AcrR family transcriptional regulator [Mesorhizobium sp. YL-MeA3-2017]OCX19957.1 TetR family transcriptional regulator [Mesorhizobium hungaricum]
MQVANPRRSNRDRTEATRSDLIAAARRLFTEKSYAETGTPEIVAAAGLTRGALYHHFVDKQALFRAVVDAEAAAVAAEIERTAPTTLSARDALLAGGEAYIGAMGVPGRTRLLLVDGPAVLGRAEMDAIDARHGNRTLREGLAATMRAGDLPRLPLDALTSLLGAAFDRAALAVDAGGSPDDYRAVLAAVIDGLMRSPSGS